MKRWRLFILKVAIMTSVCTWVFFKVALLVLLVIEDLISKGELPWLRNTGHLEPAGRRWIGNPSSTT